MLRYDQSSMWLSNELDVLLKLINQNPRETQELSVSSTACTQQIYSKPSTTIESTESRNSESIIQCLDKNFILSDSTSFATRKRKSPESCLHIPADSAIENIDANEYGSIRVVDDYQKRLSPDQKRSSKEKDSTSIAGSNDQSNFVFP